MKIKLLDSDELIDLARDIMLDKFDNQGLELPKNVDDASELTITKLEFINDEVYATVEKEN